MSVPDMVSVPPMMEAESAVPPESTSRELPALVALGETGVRPLLMICVAMADRPRYIICAFAKPVPTQTQRRSVVIAHRRAALRPQCYAVRSHPATAQIRNGGNCLF
jgi:hypothetical protein